MLTIHNHKPFSSLLLQCGVYIVPASSIHVQPQNSWNNPKQSVPVCCLTWFMHPNCLLLAPWLNGHANRISRSSHFSAYHSLPMGYVDSLVASLLGLMNQRWKIVARSLWFCMCIYDWKLSSVVSHCTQTNMMRWWNPSHWYLKRQCCEGFLQNHFHESAKGVILWRKIPQIWNAHVSWLYSVLNSTPFAHITNK